MARESLEVGVIVERRKLNNPWAEWSWAPVAVLPGAPEAAPWTALDTSDAVTRFYAGAAELELFSSETAFYRDNLRSGQPSLWVSLKPADEAPGVALSRVTADPGEGEALTETGTEIVEFVPMPAEIQEIVAAFISKHHVEREFVKRKRDRASPEALALRPAGHRTEDPE